jgi:uncharacterized protein with PQ loop repeat
MALVDRTFYYYIIIFATILFTLGFIPILFEIIQQRLTSNIPYISLIFILLAYLIYLFIAINRTYYFHSIIYLVGIISISIIIFLKKKYGDKKVIIQTKNKNKYVNEEVIYINR